MNELEKMDILRERMGISYARAKEVLDQCNGEVTDALILLEKEQETINWDEKAEKIGNRIRTQIKDILHQGNVTKVRLKKDNKVILEIPATIGALGIGGVLMNPVLAIVGVLGTVSALIQQVKIEIVRDDGVVESQDLDLSNFEDAEFQEAEEDKEA